MTSALRFWSTIMPGKASSTSTSCRCGSRQAACASSSIQAREEPSSGTPGGLDYETDAARDKRKEQWKISGKVVKTMNCTQSAHGIAGFWTTVIAAAVLTP